MPPKPTCKAVKVIGQKGARIHPKGCQIRTTVNTTTGTKTKTNKAGQQKIKAKTDEDEFYVRIKSTDNPTPGVSVPMMWDTGASMDSICYADAVKLGIQNTRRIPFVLETPGGEVHSYAFENVPLRVRLRPNTPDVQIISRQLFIQPGRRTTSSNLLGTASMKQLASVFKVEFKDML